MGGVEGGGKDLGGRSGGGGEVFWWLKRGEGGE